MQSLRDPRNLAYRKMTMFIWSRRYNTSKARNIFCWYLFARLRFFVDVFTSLRFQRKKNKWMVPAMQLWRSKLVRVRTMKREKTHCWVNFYSHHKVFIPHMMWLVKSYESPFHHVKHKCWVNILVLHMVLHTALCLFYFCKSSWLIETRFRFLVVTRDRVKYVHLQQKCNWKNSSNCIYLYHLYNSGEALCSAKGNRKWHDDINQLERCHSLDPMLITACYLLEVSHVGYI